MSANDKIVLQLSCMYIYIYIHTYKLYIYIYIYIYHVLHLFVILHLLCFLRMQDVEEPNEFVQRCRISKVTYAVLACFFVA